CNFPEKIRNNGSLPPPRARPCPVPHSDAALHQRQSRGQHGRRQTHAHLLAQRRGHHERSFPGLIPPTSRDVPSELTGYRAPVVKRPRCRSRSRGCRVRSHRLECPEQGESVMDLCLPIDKDDKAEATTTIGTTLGVHG